MLIGYARVSTVQQNLDRQLGALRAAGCVKIFSEKASGKAVEGRPALARAIDTLGTGDVLVLSEWDRCTRSMIDGIGIMQRVGARGAAIKVLDKPHLDLTTKLGQGLLALLSALAEDERERIVKRANDGRLAAKKAGTKFGRKPKLNVAQRTRARELLQRGAKLRAVAEEMNCHHSTISRLR
jgi:DNA invertase Pin-like site-specific DNA recombinase